MTEERKAVVINFSVAAATLGMALLVCAYNPEPSSWNVLAIAWNVGTALIFLVRGLDRL